MPDRHIAGLDAWRAGLLIAGLFYHGTILHDDTLAFDLIEVASTAFRMAAFFAIASFLAARSLRGRSADTWFVTRSLKIGIPAAVGIVAISPAIWAMMTLSLPKEKAAHILPFEWHHLWFLFALLIYQVVAYRIVASLPPRRIARCIVTVRQMGQGRVLLALTALSLLLTLGTLRLVLFATPTTWQPMLLEGRLIAAYTPLYLFGMALGSSRSLRNGLLRDARMPAAIVASIACTYLAWRIAVSPRLAGDVAAGFETQIRLLIGALCPPAAVLLILRSALSIRYLSPKFRQLCDASFPIYLVHYPVIIAINLTTARIDAPVIAEYIVAVMLAGGLSLAFHALVVRRSELAALLLNGRISKGDDRQLRHARDSAADSRR